MVQVEFMKQQILVSDRFWNGSGESGSVREKNISGKIFNFEGNISGIGGVLSYALIDEPKIFGSYLTRWDIYRLGSFPSI